MMRPHTAALAALALVFTTLVAPSAQAQSAQAQPARLGRVMSLTGEQPALWLDPTHAWVGGGISGVLSACTGSRCVPVVSDERCAPPLCPGNGAVYEVAAPLAQVGGWPTDYDGFTQTLEAMRGDAAFARVAGGFLTHPEHGERQQAAAAAERAGRDERRRHEESVRWVSQHRDGDRFEVSLLGSIATMAETHGSYAGAVLGLGYVAYLEDDDSDEHDEDEAFFNALIGDTFGAELRIHYHYRLDSALAVHPDHPNAGPMAEAEWFAAVGIAPVLANRFETSVARLPTVIGVIAPELGVTLRADRDATFYAAWDAPFSFLLDHDVAFDVVPRVMVADSWLPPDPDDEDEEWRAEVVFSLQLGLRLP